MKAIVVTDEAAGTAGMTLVERPEPPAVGTSAKFGGRCRGICPMCEARRAWTMAAAATRPEKEHRCPSSNSSPSRASHSPAEAGDHQAHRSNGRDRSRERASADMMRLRERVRERRGAGCGCSSAGRVPIATITSPRRSTVSPGGWGWKSAPRRTPTIIAPPRMSPTVSPAPRSRRRPRSPPCGIRVDVDHAAQLRCSARRAISVPLAL